MDRQTQRCAHYNTSPPLPRATLQLSRILRRDLSTGNCSICKVNAMPDFGGDAEILEEALMS